jgi:GTP-sensing pleiotropic transcriptional regulator CodY
MKEEAFVNNIDNYTSSISHELTMTKFPNTSNDLYATDWPSVTKKIYDILGALIRLGILMMI